MLSAVGSAGSPEDVSVAAPVRTWTGGHSKSGGSVGAPGTTDAADALALPPGMVPASFASAPKESGNDDDEQSASVRLSNANAAISPRCGKRNSVTPTPRTPHAPHQNPSQA